MMKYARKMTKPEIILVVDWLRANIAVVDGLSYAEVGQLIVSEKVIDREVLTRDQVAGIASDWGITWKRPGIGVCAKKRTGRRYRQSWKPAKANGQGGALDNGLGKQDGHQGANF